jgi:hypothetical protein
MQLTFLAGLAAMAVGVSAQTSVSPDVASVLAVLATALPADQRSYALASSSAFAAEMASSLAAGNVPGWYASLPADVKSVLPQLYPAAAQASTTPAVASATPTLSSTASSVSAVPTGSSNTTVSSVHSIQSVHSATLSASSSTAPTAPALPEATGAAASTRVALGAGLACVVGFLGMLAL